MIRVPCPHCGPRNSVEFRYVGEPRRRPDPQSTEPEPWRAYLYEHANTLGWITETWYHSAGCRRYVKVERHTLTNDTRPLPAVGPDPEGQP
jgi:heterotetrameric sarcosine oxidase delta subunit